MFYLIYRSTIRSTNQLDDTVDNQPQARFYIAIGGNSPKDLGLVLPNISAYRCKKERSVAFKIRQNAFPAEAPPGELRTLHQTL